MGKTTKTDDAAWEPQAVARALAGAGLDLDADQQTRLARALGQEWAGLRAMLDVTSTALTLAEANLRGLAAGLPGIDPAPTLRYLARVMGGATTPVVLVRLKSAEDLGRALVRLLLGDGTGVGLDLGRVTDPTAVVRLARVTLADQRLVDKALARWVDARRACQQDPVFGSGAPAQAVAHG